MDLPPTFTPRMVGFRRAPPQEGQGNLTHVLFVAVAGEVRLVSSCLR